MIALPVSVARIVLITLLALSSLGALPAGAAGAGPRSGVALAAQVPSCDVSTNLISNGSFESPAIAPGTFSTQTPTGWSGAVELANGTFNRQGPGAGSQFVRSTAGTLSQTFPTAGRGGQTLTYSISIRYQTNSTTFTFLNGSTPLAINNYLFTSPLRDDFITIGSTFVLPNPAPANVTLAISRYPSGGGTDMDLDSVVVTSNRCVGENSPTLTGLGINFRTDRNTPIDIPVTVADDTADPATLTVTTNATNRVVVSGTGANRNLRYTPQTPGIDRFNVTVSDGRLSTTYMATVIVSQPNRPPNVYELEGPYVTDAGTPLEIVFYVDDGLTPALQLTVTTTDPAGGSVVVTPLEDEPEDETLRRLIYTPDTGFSGADTFDVRISDGSLTTTVPVTVTVGPGNQPPVATGETLPAIAEDTSVLIPFASLLGNDTAGPSNEPQTLTVVSVVPAAGATATLESGGVRFTPPPDGVAETGFTYTIRDSGGLTASASAVVPITPVDDPPVAVADTLTAIDEDQTVLIPFAALTGNDSAGPADEDQTLTVTAVTPAAGAAVNIESGGVRFTLPRDGTADTGFSYTVTDGGGLTATATVTIPVRPVNDAPVIDPETVPDDAIVEATGPDGARFPFNPPTATDVDTGDTVTVTCRAPLGPEDDPDLTTDDVTVDDETDYPLGDPTTVTCTADDGSGAANGTATASFTVTVEDTTPPTVSVPAAITAEATGPDGVSVTFAVSATDLVDGPVAVTCRVGDTVVTSPHRFPLGTSRIDCTATDTRDNEGRAAFDVVVRDTVGPRVTFVGGPQPDQSYPRRQLPAAPSCVATDAVSGVVACQVSGYSAAPGPHTLTARARDSAGNETVETRTYTVTSANDATATPGPTATPRPTAPPTATPRPRNTPTPTGTPRPTVPSPATGTPRPTPRPR